MAGRELAEEQTLLKPELDPGEATGDLAADKGFAADGAFVVEEDAVAGVHAVGFAIVDADPVDLLIHLLTWAHQI